MKKRFLRRLTFLIPVIALLGVSLPLATPAMAATPTTTYTYESFSGSPSANLNLQGYLKAQIFLTTSAHSMNAVRLYLDTDAYTGYVHVSIRNVAGGGPGETTLGSGDLSLSNASVDGWYQVPLDSAVSLNDATQYAIVVSADIDYSGEHSIYWALCTNSGYTGGSPAEYMGSFWQLNGLNQEESIQESK